MTTFNQFLTSDEQSICSCLHVAQMLAIMQINVLSFHYTILFLNGFQLQEG